MTQHADPAHCQIVSVLEFLQYKLSSGTGPSTLRTYVAAISACHGLIDGISVGKHPLVARFIRGAKRLRPPTRATVPSWDLAIVLEGLAGPPFEPLESAPDRLLTLKMFFSHGHYLSKENWGFTGFVSPAILLRFCPWAS